MVAGSIGLLGAMALVLGDGSIDHVAVELFIDDHGQSHAKRNDEQYTAREDHAGALHHP